MKRITPILTLCLVIAASAVLGGCADENLPTTSQEDVDRFMTKLKEADEGDVKAQVYLAETFDKGEILLQDIPAAAMWYREAARQGNLDSQVKLADILYEGRGLPINYAESRFWYQKADEQGNIHATMRLGHMHKKGQGVMVNLKRAREYYEKVIDYASPKDEVEAGYINQAQAELKVVEKLELEALDRELEKRDRQ